MTRRSILFAALALLSLVVAYASALLYTMNASFSVADSARERYYVHYATLWGLVTIGALVVFGGCALVAWRSRKRGTGRNA